MKKKIYKKLKKINIKQTIKVVNLWAKNFAHKWLNRKKTVQFISDVYKFQKKRNKKNRLCRYKPVGIDSESYRTSLIFLPRGALELEARKGVYFESFGWSGMFAKSCCYNLPEHRNIWTIPPFGPFLETHLYLQYLKSRGVYRWWWTNQLVYDRHVFKRKDRTDYQNFKIRLMKYGTAFGFVLYPAMYIWSLFCFSFCLLKFIPPLSWVLNPFLIYFFFFFNWKVIFLSSFVYFLLFYFLYSNSKEYRFEINENFRYPWTRWTAVTDIVRPQLLPLFRRINRRHRLSNHWEFKHSWFGIFRDFLMPMKSLLTQFRERRHTHSFNYFWWERKRWFRDPLTTIWHNDRYHFWGDICWNYGPFGPLDGDSLRTRLLYAHPKLLLRRIMMDTARWTYLFRKKIQTQKTSMTSGRYVYQFVHAFNKFRMWISEKFGHHVLYLIWLIKKPIDQSFRQLFLIRSLRYQTYTIPSRLRFPEIGVKQLKSKELERYFSPKPVNPGYNYVLFKYPFLNFLHWRHWVLHFWYFAAHVRAQRRGWEILLAHDWSRKYKKKFITESNATLRQLIVMDSRFVILSPYENFSVWSPGFIRFDKFRVQYLYNFLKIYPRQFLILFLTNFSTNSDCISYQVNYLIKMSKKNRKKNYLNTYFQLFLFSNFVKFGQLPYLVEISKFKRKA